MGMSLRKIFGAKRVFKLVKVVRIYQKKCAEGREENIVTSAKLNIVGFKHTASKLTYKNGNTLYTCEDKTALPA
jgi:hypothetical protein